MACRRADDSKHSGAAISHAGAQVLRGTLGGRIVPPDWRGTLPIIYWVWPGAAIVHLTAKSDWSIKPMYDVIATM